MSYSLVVTTEAIAMCNQLFFFFFFTTYVILGLITFLFLIVPFGFNIALAQQ